MGQMIILASQSPRRIEMMQKHGINPVIKPARIEEDLPKVYGMREVPMFLALKKAKAVEAELIIENGCNDFEPGDREIIIAADTIVYCDGEIMGKPESKEDGYRMLTKLRGRTHQVVTGVCILEAECSNTRVFSEVTQVHFKDYSDEEIDAYLDTKEPYDKAGGYAIQGSFGKYVESIEGDYDNVVGFPWERIQKELKKVEDER